MFDPEKVVFKLEVSDEGYPPVQYESLWAIRQMQGSYVIDNMPYYIYGVSKGDAVAVDQLDGDHFASFVVSRGGHSTLRVFVDELSSRNSIIDNLIELGAKCSSSKGLSLFVVDIPPEVDFKEIDSFLLSRCDDEHVAYEDACLQHDGIEQARLQECADLATIPLRLN
ncbi:DUF4265 domain-containing protein [Paraburkholderia sp.]|uniref:DUF4265 domain-containing protein n=1 Tax=Paraburkholderia sp. TaxID=1926495 RepID=UPI00286F1EFC|nr:DUF4265 domain-containing protein [Paraburkholderia sp.]